MRRPARRNNGAPTRASRSSSRRLNADWERCRSEPARVTPPDSATASTSPKSARSRRIADGAELCTSCIDSMQKDRWIACFCKSRLQAMKNSFDRFQLNGDDPHPTTLDDEPTIDRTISVDAHTGAANSPLLFVIDPRPYEIQLEQANAQFQTASATLALANKQLERSARLNRVAVESDEHLDESTQSQRAAAAAVKAAEAAIHAAQLNIEFTHIVAPFSGRVSRRHVSIGSLITGGPGATSATELTTIVSLDPIYLDFDLSEADYTAYQHSAAARPSGAIAVRISVDGERPWARAGDLDFLDNEIDRRSGTLHARATLANPDMMIAPGGFARVRVPLSASWPQLLGPGAAVGTDQSSKLVMVVQDDGVVVPKPVETGPLEDHAMRVITHGLLPNERVVVQGLMRTRPGMKAEPHLTTVDANTNN